MLIFWGDLGQERFESGAHTTVCLEDGRGDDCGSVFRPLLALCDGGGFAHHTSGLNTERGGNLDVNELVGYLDTWFGDSHVHYRAVFGVNGRVVHEDVCTKAGSSRNVRNLVSQSVEGVSARACRRVFAFLVQGGSALGSVALLVFAPITGVAHGSALPHSGRVLDCGVVHNRGVGDGELEETGGVGPTGAVKSNPVSAVGSNVITQALLTRESARARCEVAVDPSLVRSLGSSPASRLMAWSLDRADLNPGISAERSSMHPSPILTVSSAEASPKPPSRIGMKSCFACATVKSPTPRMA